VCCECFPYSAVSMRTGKQFFWFKAFSPASENVFRQLLTLEAAVWEENLNGCEHVENGACYFPPKLLEMKSSEWLTERPNLARNTQYLAVYFQTLQTPLIDEARTVPPQKMKER